VEHKVGPRRARKADEVQLCAQALCLEEMLGVEVPKGALFYRASRRRREVVFTPALRAFVEETVEKVQELLRTAQLPPPVNDARCRDCSLAEACMPYLVDLVREGDS